jgi:hypothetical protein
VKTGNQTLQRFRKELCHHLAGWRNKAREDFSESNLEKELIALTNDPVYSKFHLATADYVLIRLMGRMSISIGRRLGEIYDKIPRIAAQARYSLTQEKVIAKFNGLELDIQLRLNDLSQEDAGHLSEVCKQHLEIDLASYHGIGIEIRYNFNPNDSARLRKDKELADLLKSDSLHPTYLIFAENSPRLNDAVASLTRAGWSFVIGDSALKFMSDLVGFDISNVLEQSEISDEIQSEIEQLMSDIQNSHAFNQIQRFQL